jgi:hypothetical protein
MARKRLRVKDSRFGTHRSEALAERHRRQLEREFGGVWIIAERRSQRGYRSRRGRQFRFDQIAAAVAEYVVHFDYGKKKKGNVIDVQVHLIGPSDASDEAAINAAADLMVGYDLPQGWEAKTIAWRDKSEHTPGKMADAAADLRFAIAGRTSVTRSEIE